MAENLGNDFSVALGAAIADDSTTSITVVSGTGAPDANFRIRVEDEYMLVTSKGSGTDWTVTRGIEGTTAAAHPIGAIVYHVLTTAGLKQYLDERFAALNANLTALSGLTGAANKLGYFTGLGEMSLADFTATGRSIVAAATIAAAATVLGLGTTDSPTFAGATLSTGDLTVTAGDVTVTAGQVLTGFGSEAAPSHSFAGLPNWGIFYDTTNSVIAISSAGIERWGFRSNPIWGFVSGATMPLSWSSTVSITTPDLYLFRDAANTLAQRNGTSAQGFRIYNSFTDASNYERGYINWSGNVLTVGVTSAGTGASRSLRIETLQAQKIAFAIGAIERWNISADNHLLTVADNVYDIGASDSTRPRNAYLGSIVRIGHTTSASTNSYLQFGKYETSSEAGMPRIRHGSLIVAGVTSDLVFETTSTGGGFVFANVSKGTQFTINLATTSVNYLEARGGATGDAPGMSAVGSDTNIDLALTIKGSGKLKFGTHTAIAAETVTGYITVKDAGGTERKLAVVS